MCLCILHALIVTSCLVCYRIEVEPEVIPEAEDCQYDPRQQGKQTPIDHVDKNPFLSHSCICIVYDVTMMRFYHIVEPIPLHDLSFCHSSKQTTILADLGVDC